MTSPASNPMSMPSTKLPSSQPQPALSACRRACKNPCSRSTVAKTLPMTPKVPQPAVLKSAASPLPVFVALGAGLLVAGMYVASQLESQASRYDHYFESYNTPEREQSRHRSFEPSPHDDPRTSLFNVLGWKRS